MWTGQGLGYRSFSALLLRVGYPESVFPAKRLETGVRSISLASKVQDSSNNDVNIRESMTDCDNIDSLAVSGTESMGVTTLVQEACESVDVLGRFYARPKQLSVQPSIQNLTDYFSRPRIISTFPLATTASRMYFQTLTNASIFSTIFPQGLNRLAGVYGLRFKIVFTLQVAATPFHQGVIALSFQYGESETGRLFDRSVRSCTCTNIPHSRLDISNSTMTQLSVPFLFSTDFINLVRLPTDDTWQYGSVAVNMLLPSPSVASLAPATAKLLCHLEDLEFFGASPFDVTQVTLQAGKVIASAEKEYDFDARPLSSSVQSVAAMVKWAGPYIPLLSSFSGTASWAIGRAAGVLRYLGYSKPQIQDAIVRVRHTPSVCETNVDVPSATLMVAPFASNHVVVDPAFGGTDLDETSLAYLNSQWGQIMLGSLPNSASVGATLYATYVSPINFWFRQPSTGLPYCNIVPPYTITANFNSIQPSHLFYWATMFHYWRGDIEFRVTFSKTKMHAGRVLAQFIPTDDESLTNNTTVPCPEFSGGVPQPFGHSAIWDLKDDNVFTFTCPHVVPSPFLSYVSATGAFSITVLDPLIAPSMVANTIDFLVEVRGGPNFNLAKVNGPIFPAHPTGTPSLQSGAILPAESDASQVTVGEQVSSVKQLISIPSRTVIPLSTNGTFNLTMLPWFYHRTYPVLVPGPLGNAMRKQSFTLGGNVAQAYLYVKGSTDVHVYNRMDDGSVAMVACNSPAQGNSVAPTSTWLNRPVSATPIVIENSGSAHFRFPLYNRVRRVYSSVFNNEIWDPSNAGQWFFSSTNFRYDFCIPKVTFFNYSTTTTSAAITTRAAGDDATVAHYMGPPPVVIPSSDTGTVYDPDSSGF